MKTRFSYISLASFLFLLSSLIPVPADAGCKLVTRGLKSYVKCSGDVAKIAGKISTTIKEDVVKPIEKGAKHLIKETSKEATKVVKGVERVGQDVGREIGSGTQEILNVLKDIERETRSGLKNVEEAAHATGKFLENQVHGVGNSLSAAERRLREGKVVDAIWHLGTDPIQYTEENSFKMAQESSLVRAAGQIAAQAYGGPAGAAAYATWYSYRATGDAELALRVGMITGATSAALGKISEIESEKFVRKAIVAGAVGGLAVAASGGDEKAIREGFLLAGGMVLVQDGYKHVTNTKLDARGSKGPAYCMATVGAECSPSSEAYIRNEDGTIKFKTIGKDTVPIVDVTKTDPTRPHVGIQSKVTDSNFYHERGVVMTAISRAPLTNAMSIFHDTWAISWNMTPLESGATIPPAVLLTYIGTGAPYFDLIQETNVQKYSNSASLTPDQTNLVDKLSKKPKPKGAIYPSARGVSDFSFLCSNSGLERSILVDRSRIPGQLACRVVYDTEKGRTIPWQAKFETDYCTPKAVALVLKLQNWGWSCFGRQD